MEVYPNHIIGTIIAFISTRTCAIHRVITCCTSHVNCHYCLTTFSNVFIRY
jgi:hypothetical protein